jgi:LPXTG-motif cell wall-anchored protein
MRKNVKQQLALRVLSTAALMAMVSSIATAAFAAEYNVAKGSVEIVAKDGIQSITQRDDTGAFVKDEKGDIDHRQDDDIILTTKNKDTGETETTSNTVTITAEEKGDTANVTLQDVHIETEGSWNNTGSAPIEIKGNGDTNLELNGDNTVLSGDSYHAAIEKADKNGTGTLTIKDDKNDDRSDKDKDENGNAVGRDTGKLLAGGNYAGAGIGGGSSSNDLADTSNITIKGGEVTARSGYDYSAGIGGGSNGTAKNIRIEGNAHVTASGRGGAAIGGGCLGGNDITITGDAVVNAYGEYGSAIGDGDPWGYTSSDTTITISGNAKVNAEAKNGAPAIGSSQHGNRGNLTITIADNANVTAIGSTGAPAIGNDYALSDNIGNTTIRITGGTVHAINSYDDNKNFRKDYPAIGVESGKLNLTIDGSTGDTVVNVYQNGDAVPDGIGEPTTDPETGKTVYKIPTSADYNEDGSSNLGEKNSVVINYYKNASVTNEPLQLPETLDRYAGFSYGHYGQHCTIAGGTLTKVVHNRKYMEENPNIDTSKLKDEDLHDWKLNTDGEYKEPTLEEDGYADYICSIDKCGQTKRVPLPKLTPEPSEPDTPSTPSTPDTPDTPSTPVTPDAPVQDAVPDTAPADAAVTPAAAQNAVQDAKPEAAATAAVSAAALPQTGANWLAVVGSALSGLFLLAAGFVLDRKGRRMN